MHNKITALAFIVFSLFSVTVGAAEAPRDPYTYFFNETFGDFSEELQNAKDQGKKGVMIFFEMDECPFCHWMKMNVLNRPDVQEYYRKNFLMFPVDIEGDIQITDFKGKTMSQKDFAFKEYRVRATPVIAFFDLDGNIVQRHTGRTATAEEFMLMGHYVAEGHYKDMRFAAYKRKHRD
ncbi:MAG: thioredoxin family protein [Candidatus Thiodiazotropha sp.]